MIEALTPGLRVLLPSGNVLVLLRCEEGDWVCLYTELARARGEVVFTAAWLGRWGQHI